MDCEVVIVDEGSDGESFEEIDEHFIDVGVVLLAGWVGSGIHYNLKL